MTNISNMHSSWIFDYLNNNRHKFDESGNFDPKPDQRDYFPLAGSLTPWWPWWWKYIQKDTTPDDVSRERNAAELQDLENGKKYTRKECLDEYENDLELCDDGPGGRVRDACYKRANDRLTNCYSKGNYNGVGRWTFQDATGQPQGAEDDLDKRRKSDSKADPKPENKPDDTKRVMAQALKAFLGLNPALAATLTAPQRAQILPRLYPDEMQRLLNNITLLRSDYPEGHEPPTDYGPALSLQPLLMMNPMGGAALMGTRLPAFAPR